MDSGEYVATIVTSSKNPSGSGPGTKPGSVTEVSNPDKRVKDGSKVEDTGPSNAGNNEKSSSKLKNGGLEKRRSSEEVKSKINISVPSVEKRRKLSKRELILPTSNAGNNEKSSSKLKNGGLEKRRSSEEVKSKINISVPSVEKRRKLSKRELILPTSREKIDLNARQSILKRKGISKSGVSDHTTARNQTKTIPISVIKIVSEIHPTIVSVLDNVLNLKKPSLPVEKTQQWVISQIDRIYSERRSWEKYVESIEKTNITKMELDIKRNVNTDRKIENLNEQLVSTKGLFAKFILAYYQGRSGVISMAGNDLWTLIANCVYLREKVGSNSSNVLKMYVEVFEKLIEHDDPNIVTFIMYCKDALKRYQRYSRDKDIILNKIEGTRDRETHGIRKSELVPFIYPKECALVARDIFSFIDSEDGGSTNQADNSVLSEAVLECLCSLTSGKLLTDPKLQIGRASCRERVWYQV